MIFRHIVHSMPCAVVQFIKGGMSTGERDLIPSVRADECAFHTMGEGLGNGTKPATPKWRWPHGKRPALIRDPATHGAAG
jgi:cob(I)alamin adenosyltransferase